MQRILFQQVVQSFDCFKWSSSQELGISWWWCSVRVTYVHITYLKYSTYFQIIGPLDKFKMELRWKRQGEHYHTWGRELSKVDAKKKPKRRETIQILTCYILLGINQTWQYCPYKSLWQNVTTLAVTNNSWDRGLGGVLIECSAANKWKVGSNSPLYKMAK